MLRKAAGFNTCCAGRLDTKVEFPRSRCISQTAITDAVAADSLQPPCGLCGGVEKNKNPPTEVDGHWCAWGDLNSHVIRHWNLNPARLPIPPQAQNTADRAQGYDLEQ